MLRQLLTNSGTAAHVSPKWGHVNGKLVGLGFSATAQPQPFDVRRRAISVAAYPAALIVQALAQKSEMHNRREFSWREELHARDKLNDFQRLSMTHTLGWGEGGGGGCRWDLR